MDIYSLIWPLYYKHYERRGEFAAWQCVCTECQSEAFYDEESGEIECPTCKRVAGKITIKVKRCPECGWHVMDFRSACVTGEEEGVWLCERCRARFHNCTYNSGPKGPADMPGKCPACGLLGLRHNEFWECEICKTHFPENIKSDMVPLHHCPHCSKRTLYKNDVEVVINKYNRKKGTFHYWSCAYCEYNFDHKTFAQIDPKIKIVEKDEKDEFTDFGIKIVSHIDNQLKQ